MDTKPFLGLATRPRGVRGAHAGFVCLHQANDSGAGHSAARRGMVPEGAATSPSLRRSASSSARLPADSWAGPALVMVNKVTGKATVAPHVPAAGVLHVLGAGFLRRQADLEVHRAAEAVELAVAKLSREVCYGQISRHVLGRHFGC